MVNQSLSFAKNIDQSGRQARKITNAISHQIANAGLSDQLNDAESRYLRAADDLSLAIVEGIISRCGWAAFANLPTSTLESAVLVIHHANPEKRARYLPAIEAAAASGQLSAEWWAVYIDRTLIAEDQPQRYGTQIPIYRPNSGFKSVEDAVEFWRVEDPANLDSRRSKLGLPPFCDYLNRINDTDALHAKVCGLQHATGHR
ncbi:DUF6624 domain-containing protein [Roseateles sp. BYS87W]|uniref:DUF6624 domain-containing protein n=1 Tax=Pelomonas baiyunensis TaxID=3299026 RepID=A0ABW7H1L3_9BURK